MAYAIHVYIPIVKTFNVNGNDILVHVPIGYECDGITIPCWLKPIAAIFGITPTCKYSESAIIHDWLCETNLVSREIADEIFHLNLLNQGCPRFKRWIMWKSVKIGSKLGY